MCPGIVTQKNVEDLSINDNVFFVNSKTSLALILEPDLYIISKLPSSIASAPILTASASSSGTTDETKIGKSVKLLAYSITSLLAEISTAEALASVAAMITFLIFSISKLLIPAIIFT